MTPNLRNGSRMRLDRVGKLIEEDVTAAACRRFPTKFGRRGFVTACAMTLLAATWAPALTQDGRKSRLCVEGQPIPAVFALAFPHFHGGE